MGKIKGGKYDKIDAAPPRQKVGRDMGWSADGPGGGPGTVVSVKALGLTICNLLSDQHPECYSQPGGLGRVEEGSSVARRAAMQLQGHK